MPIDRRAFVKAALAAGGTPSATPAPGAIPRASSFLDLAVPPDHVFVRTEESTVALERRGSES